MRVPILLLATIALSACGTAAYRVPDRVLIPEKALNTWMEINHRLDSLRYVDARSRVASDSGLVYEYQWCESYTFDSANGVLVRRILHGPVDAIRAEMTPQQFETIVAEADRIGLWSYPTDFGDAETLELGPDSLYSRVVSSASHRRLDLRDSGRSVSVRWSNSIQSGLSEDAKRLRALGRRIETYIGARAARDLFPSTKLAGNCM